LHKPAYTYLNPYKPTYAYLNIHKKSVKSQHKSVKPHRYKHTQTYINLSEPT